jgi:hypothetical protein
MRVHGSRDGCAHLKSFGKCQTCAPSENLPKTLHTGGILGKSMGKSRRK